MGELIEVCSACLRASCWHGEFFCDEHQNAGTVKMSRSELDLRDLEHKSNYSTEKLNAVYGSEDK